MKARKIFFTAKNGIKVEVAGFETNSILAESFLKETGYIVADGASISKDLIKEKHSHEETYHTWNSTCGRQTVLGR